MNTSSFGKIVPAATHDCSTLGGNSGSAVLDLENGDVLALHFGGAYQKQNYAVPAFELGRDSRVIATGVRFAGKPLGGTNDWSNWWSRADGAESVAATANAPLAAAKAAESKADSRRGGVKIGRGQEMARIEVPLRITISVEIDRDLAKSIVATESPGGEAIESAREPFRDADFSTRKGYDPGFLNDPKQEKLLASVDVPMPLPADPSVLAKDRSGEVVIHYENFSIKMHAQRRLALITASNVTKAPDLKRPEPDRDYTRRGLSGLGAVIRSAGSLIRVWMKGFKFLMFSSPRIERPLTRAISSGVTTFRGARPMNSSAGPMAIPIMSRIAHPRLPVLTDPQRAKIIGGS